MIVRPVLFPRLGVGGVTFVQCVALLPPLAVALIERGVGQAEMLAVALVTAIVWDLIFATMRKERFAFHGLSTALIVTVLVPSTLPWWQLALTLSLGCVLGDHIFGGRGFGFLNSATICLSLLLLSFPQVQLEAISSTVALATAPGAVILLAAGLISGRIIVGALCSIAALAFAANPELNLFLLGTASIFGLVFVTCDPVAAASTRPGRLIYGLLAGLMISLFSPESDAITSASVVFGSLTASVFAPLIDHLVVIVQARHRAVRGLRRRRQPIA